MIRYGFTGYTGESHVKEVLALLDKSSLPLTFLPYGVSQTRFIPDVDTDFKKQFTDKTGLEFTPQNFRDYRLRNLKECDCMLVVRDTMSESTAFELGYLYSTRPDIPVFFAIHESAEIKTTLIRELNANSEYITFNKATDVREPLHTWLDDLFGSSDFQWGPL